MVNKINEELIYEFIDKNKQKLVSLVIILLLVFPTESILLPRLYSNLFESMKSGKLLQVFDFNYILENIKQRNPAGIIWLIIILWFFVTVGFYLRQTLESFIVPKYLSHIRQKLFEKSIHTYSSNYKDIKIGEYIGRIFNLSRNMTEIFQISISSILPTAISSIAIASYFLVKNRSIGIIVTLSIVISGFLLYFMIDKISNMSKNREKYWLKMSEKISDRFNNLMNIYLNNQTAGEINKNNSEEDYHTQLLIDQSNASKKLVMSLFSISIITFLVSLIVAYEMVKKNFISRTNFISITIILIYFTGYLIKMSTDIPTICQRIGNIRASESFLNEILSVKNEARTEYIKNNSVQFVNVSFKYPKTNKYILENINISFNEGKKVAIVGPSGSGKTTIMKLMLNMYKPTNGTIFIGNKDMLTINLSELRNKVNYINQRTLLFNTSILNNIKYGNSANDKEIYKTVNEYNLNTTYNGAKNGLNTVAGVNGNNLSLGMQKVTMILRGIFKKGSIVIFDEPLAGLDSGSRQKIIKLIMEKCKNKTVIIITHDREILPYVDQTINMDEISQHKN